MKFIACITMLLVTALSAGAALAGAATAPTPTAAKTVLPPDAPARMAGGETFYEGGYIPLNLLLDDYHATHAQLDEVVVKNKAARAQLEGAQKDLAPLKAKVDELMGPSLGELEEAKARLAELQKVLATPLSAPGEQEMLKQKLRPDGSAPPDGAISGGSAYSPEAPEWRKQSAVGLAKSRQEQQDYQKALDELRKDQAAALKELPGVEATIQKDEAKLAEIQSHAPPELVALMTKVAAAEDEVKTGEQDAQVLQDRIKSMGNAFRLVDEPLRLKYDVVEWEGGFVRLADLEKAAADIKADIARARERIAADAKAAGKPFPADWKPSQQDRLDAVTALIQKVKDAQEVKKPAPPAVKTAPGAKPAATPTAPAK